MVKIEASRHIYNGNSNYFDFLLLSLPLTTSNVNAGVI